MWEEPKTNWVATDYINITDYNRWKNNLNYLKGLLSKLVSVNEWEDMGLDKTYNDIPYAEDINKIENNIKNIYNSKTFYFDIGDTKEYYQNTKTIDYEEINRIEKLMVRFEEQLSREIKALKIIPFKLGISQIGG